MSFFEKPMFGGGTTLDAPGMIPTAIVNATETVLDVNPPNSTFSNSLQKWDGVHLPDIFPWFFELLWILLVLSVPIVFFKAYRRKKYLAATKDRESERVASLADLWLTPSWMALFGLYDLYILGILPVGPWNKKSDKSLKSWPEKRYLRRLVHMGIVPLYIQDGGVETRQEKSLELSDESPRMTLPKYVQGKRRAYFEFLVPMGRGYSNPEHKWHDPRTRPFRQFIQTLLANRHNYLVTVSSFRPDTTLKTSHPLHGHTQPLEVGASSWLEALLPFKRDRILQPAKGQDVQDISDFIKPNFSPLLETQKCPLVRVEVPDFRKRRLDEWVYGIAQKSGLGMVWNEGALHAHASGWMRDNSVELPEYLIPTKDRV